MVGALVLRGVRLSARVVLLIESVSITLMVVVFACCWSAARRRPRPRAGRRSGLAGIAAGVLPALAAFIGFEAATALGVEARRPFRGVPRAVIATAAVVGLLYLFAAHTQVVGFATTPGGLAGQPNRCSTLAAVQVGRGSRRCSTSG